MKIMITGAWVDGVFYEADEPFEIASDDWPWRSIHAIACENGIKEWKLRYRETPDEIVYTTK